MGLFAKLIKTMINMLRLARVGGGTMWVVCGLPVLLRQRCRFWCCIGGEARGDWLVTAPRWCFVLRWASSGGGVGEATRSWLLQ
jgi:hypothetical protein